MMENSIRSRIIANLQVADDISAPAEEKQELEALCKGHDKLDTR